MQSESDAPRRTVMICDDEEDILTLYGNFLKRKFNIITATSGEMCLSKYQMEMKQDKKVDVLLLDYRLGDMLGDEVACKIKDLDGNKTILISAYEIDKSVLTKLSEAGCIVSDMKKPISLAELQKNIQALLK
jgi:response regulator RpfG family c-di-GMP phosphodiesterase